MVNYEEALKKPFSDIGKLVLGIILSVVPIVNWIAQGYVIENSGLGKNKPSKKMPEWNNLGDYFIKGLLSYIVIFIYALPAIIIFSAAIGYAAASLTTTYMGVVPEGFMSEMMVGSLTREDVSQLAQLISQKWMLAMPALITIAPVVILGLILLAFAVYLSPVAVLNYLKNKKFGKAFDFNFVVSKAFTPSYFIVWIIGGVVALVLKTILSFIPLVGSAAAFFVSGLIVYNLYGQVFREKK